MSGARSCKATGLAFFFSPKVEVEIGSDNVQIYILKVSPLRTRGTEVQTRRGFVKVELVYHIQFIFYRRIIKL